MANLKKNLEALKSHLDKDEIVEQCVFGAYETKMMDKKTVRNGIFAATNKKVTFFGKKMFGYNMEIYPYSNISSIEMSKELMGHRISFFASGNKVSMKWINQGQIPQFIETVKSKIGKKESVTEAVTKEDIYSKIEKLNELREKKILTEEEFNSKKQELLARI